MSNIDLLIKELKKTCKKCKYFDSEEHTCSYGAYDRPINIAIEEFLLGKVCTFEGDLRFIKDQKALEVKNK